MTDDVVSAGVEDVDLAVKYAQAAFTTGPWATFTGQQRALCMIRFADLVEKAAAELAYLETISMGRPIATLLGVDIPHMAACFRCRSLILHDLCMLPGPNMGHHPPDYAGWADKIEGESFPADDGVYKLVRHEPLGVCAGIASWILNWVGLAK